MALTPQQSAALGAAMLANQALTQWVQDRRDDLIKDYYNAASSPTIKVWRTSVSRAEIYNRVSDEGTTWSWTFYKNQSAVEQNAWVQMFMGDQADFSQDNFRAGIASIFTSASAANATHALAVGKRTATRAEALFATGTGSVAVPAKLAFQGDVTVSEISAILNAAGG